MFLNTSLSVYFKYVSLRPTLISVHGRHTASHRGAGDGTKPRDVATPIGLLNKIRKYGGTCYHRPWPHRGDRSCDHGGGRISLSMKNQWKWLPCDQFLFGDRVAFAVSFCCYCVAFALFGFSLWPPNRRVFGIIHVCFVRVSPSTVNVQVRRSHIFGGRRDLRRCVWLCVFLTSVVRVRKRCRIRGIAGVSYDSNPQWKFGVVDVGNPIDQVTTIFKVSVTLLYVIYYYFCSVGIISLIFVIVQHSPLTYIRWFSLQMIVIPGSLTRNLNPSYYSTSDPWRPLMVQQSALTI